MTGRRPHRWVVLETSAGDAIVVERLPDGSVAWRRNPKGLEARRAGARVVRSARCGADGAGPQSLGELLAACGGVGSASEAAPEDCFALRLFEAASRRGAAEPPDAKGEEAQEPAEGDKSHLGARPVTFSLEPFSAFDPSSVTAEDVEPVDGRYRRFGGRCMALRHVLTERECEYIVASMGGHGEMESVRYRHDYRRNDRAVFDSAELAAVLWARVAPFAAGLAVHVDRDPARQRLLCERDAPGECPSELRVGFGMEGVWHPVGLNECLRFCKYNPGDFFRKHCDACFQRGPDEQSLFTCMFYLNGDLDGGATRFLRLDRAGEYGAEDQFKPAREDDILASVAPEPGLCICFFQPGLLHEGDDLRSGRKYILRSDVMFRRDPATKPKLTPKEDEALDLLKRAETAEERGECDLACSLYRRAYKLDPRLEFVR